MRGISLVTVATVTIVLVFHTGCVHSQNEVDQPQCSATKVWSRKVTIDNSLDANGKVIAKVAFEKERAEAGNRSESWVVDVEQNVESCEGIALSSRVIYTLSGGVPFPHYRTDYKLFPGVGYYKFHPEVVTWPKAREICSEEDAHLVIFNSEQESSVAVKLFARHPTIKGASSNDWAFVGLQERPSAKGIPHTIFGENFNTTGFARWSPGQPTDRTLDDYMVFHRSNGGYADINIAAAWKLAFICEKEFW